jgi:hypothetical protein
VRAAIATARQLSVHQINFESQAEGEAYHLVCRAKDFLLLAVRDIAPDEPTRTDLFDVPRQVGSVDFRPIPARLKPLLA